MPALNFQKQFTDAVESGKKCQTIRAYRKVRDPKVGDTLYLYTGMRTKQCRKLGEVECTSVEHVKIGRYCASMSHKDDFAQADGFDTYGAMLDWFEQTHGLPFEGLLIRWDAQEMAGEENAD